MNAASEEKVQGSYWGNFLIPAVILAWAAIYFVETLGYPVLEDVGPGGVPQMWIGFASAFCAFLAVQALRKRGDVDPKVGRIGLVALFAGWLALYLWTLEPVGYFVTTLVFMIGSMYMMAYRNYVVMISVTLGWLVFCYLIFVKLLYISLPIGPLLRPILE